MENNLNSEINHTIRNYDLSEKIAHANNDPDIIYRAIRDEKDYAFGADVSIPMLRLSGGVLSFGNSSIEVGDCYVSRGETYRCGKENELYSEDMFNLLIMSGRFIQKFI